MPTSPLTTTPYPAASGVDPPDGPAQIAAAVLQLERFTIPRFSSLAALTSAIPSPSEGMFIYLLDVHQYQRYDGAAWRVCTLESIVTSTTRPATPSAGLAIWESDSGRHLYWTGTGWVDIVAGPVGAPTAYTPTITNGSSTITSPAGWYRRIAGALDLWGSYTVTTGANGQLTISLPSGFTPGGVTGTVLAGAYCSTPSASPSALLAAAGASTVTGGTTSPTAGAYVFNARVPLAT